MKDKQTIKKAVIPVAGLGSRFLPITLGVSKEMLPVIDAPVLLLILKECADSGITDVLLITRKGKGDIKKFFTQPASVIEGFEKNGKAKELELYKSVMSRLKISFRFQRNDLTGSGGAVYVAKKWCNGEPFAVLFGDDINYVEEGEVPAIGQLINVYEKHHKLVLGCKKVEKSEISAYGSMILGEEVEEGLYQSSGVVEKPKPGTEPSLIASLARYVLPGNAFSYIERHLSCDRDITKEVCLTRDCMDEILREQGGYAKIMESIRFDTGNKLGYLKCITHYALLDNTFGEDYKNFLKTLV